MRTTPAITHTRAGIRGGGGLKRSANITAYLMIAPCVILLTIFVTFPLLNAVRWSFYEWSFYRESPYVGTRNFEIVLGDRYFYNSLLVGLRWVGLVVPTRFVLAFVLALVLKHQSRAMGPIVKTAVFAPHVTSVVVSSWIFSYIFDYQAGILNGLLRAVGVGRIAWLSEVSLALPAQAVIMIWMSFGFETLIMLAGVNDIPETYYEAAIIDGANFLQQTWRITVPMMKNVFLFVLVTSTTATMQSFQIQDLTTQGGPLRSTTTPNLLIFNHFRSDFTLGYTMAAALLLFVVIASISMVLFRVIQSEKLGE